MKTEHENMGVVKEKRPVMGIITKKYLPSW